MRFYTNVACQGNYIYYRGIEDGRRVRLKLEYSPTLFLPSRSGTPTKWTDLHGHPVDTMEFGSIREARDFIKRYEDVEGFTIHGNSRFEYTFIADQHPEEVMEWNINDIVVAYIDIEVGTEHGLPTVETASNPITAITVKLSNDPEYFVFGCGNYKPHRPDIHWLNCQSEDDLLRTFLNFWNDKCPDVVTGWNVKTFDIPYIVARSARMIGEDQTRWLSPWGKINLKEETFYGKPQRVYQLVGIETLDYLQLFRKYAPNAAQESYKLDHVAHVELKERKVSYEEYETLHNLYLRDYQKFIEYNIKDVELVEKLNAKGRLIDMALTLAYDSKTNYGDVFSQVRMWDTICYNSLRRKGVVIPPKKSSHKEQAYEGAYVKDPQIGMAEWVASFDLDSLYPHLIMQYNLSPEMIIEPEDYNDTHRAILAQGVNVPNLLSRKINLSGMDRCTITPNGQFFKTTKQGFLAEIMQSMYNDRVVYKKKMIEAQKEKEACTDPEKKKEIEARISRFKNLQLAKKVCLNSAYGAMGNEHFRFFDVRIAEGVTSAGQLSIRWVENKLNETLNAVMKTANVDYVLASDTDSVYLNLGPMVKSFYKGPSDTAAIIKWMDKLCATKINAVVEETYKELAAYVHAYEQKMRMKRESLVDKAIWTAKKRYILNVWDSEGVAYKEPDLKIQGLEAIKSSTPKACRDKIKDALKIIIKGTERELQEYIEKFHQEFKTLPIADIAFPRGINGLLEYRDANTVYRKSTPIHVKGALLYNHFIKKYGLESDYEIIRDGDKIKFIHLKMPNIFGDPVISFVNRVPKEFHLENYVDYETQFEKSFVEPLSIILSCIGWSAVKSSTLEDFFL